jgi:hypothetical protein
MASGVPDFAKMPTIEAVSIPGMKVGIGAPGGACAED